VLLLSLPLGDILSPAPRRLHHLVHRASPLVEEVIAERDRAVIDDRGDPKRVQRAVTTAGAKPSLAGALIESARSVQFLRHPVVLHQLLAALSPFHLAAR
jgi:hypothetical protein